MTFQCSECGIPFDSKRALAGHRHKHTYEHLQTVANKYKQLQTDSEELRAICKKLIDYCEDAYTDSIDQSKHIDFLYNSVLQLFNTYEEYKKNLRNSVYSEEKEARQDLEKQVGMWKRDLINKLKQNSEFT